MNNRTWSATVLVVGLIALSACIWLILVGRSTTFIEVNKANFQEQVLKSPIPVLIEVYVNGCSPCSQQIPIIEKVARDYKDKVRFVRLNASENSGFARLFQLKYLPTHIFFTPATQSALKGEGVLDEKAMRQFLDEGLAQPKPVDQDKEPTANPADRTPNGAPAVPGPAAQPAQPGPAAQPPQPDPAIQPPQPAPPVAPQQPVTKP
jgi:thioredoxin 1